MTRVRRGTLMLVLASVLNLLLFTTAAPESAAAPTQCPMGGGQTEEVEAEKVPVLFVHGIISGPEFWQEAAPGRQSLFQLADRVSGAAAYAFNYRNAGLSWVTDERIGPALAETINCLTATSGRQVVVVAHSMGGLAMQFALAQDGGKTANNVAEVVTLGTPFEGSVLLSVSQAAITGGDTIAAAGGNPGLAIGMEAVLSLCAKWGQGELGRGRDNPCSFASVPRSPVGTALLFGSANIDELPPWPSDEPLQSQAGDIGVEVALTIGDPPTRVLLGRVGIGDGPVTVDSATATGSAGQPVRCALGNPLSLFDSECWHTKLQTNPRLADVVLSAVRSSVTAQTPTPVTDVNWFNRRYEVACTGIAERPFTSEVRDGSGSGPADALNDGFEIRVVQVVTGDLTHDGSPETAVLLACAPRAASPNFFTVEVQLFTSGPRKLAALYPPGAKSEFGFEPRFNGQPFEVGADGVLRTGANYWVDQDGHCCPSVSRSIAWMWDGRQFLPS